MKKIKKIKKMEIWKSKLKIKIENKNWKSKLKIEIEIENRKLKIEFETWKAKNDIGN